MARQNTDVTTRGITLDRALMDWLTVTSFDEMYHEVQKAIWHNVAEGYGARNEKEGVKRLQYMGKSCETGLGSLFVGSGEQKGRAHYMTQAGGEICNESALLIPTWQGLREGGWQKVRRLDLQMTVLRPVGWNQWALFNRSKLARKSVGWFESTDKDGILTQTVYIGKRTSEKFLRVYEKWIGGAMCLRCEYELKGNTAEAFARMLASGKETYSSLLKLLVSQTNDEGLDLLYLPKLERAPTAEKPKILVPESKTEKWLLETVLPTFEKWINDHNNSDDVINAFYGAIDRRDKWI